MRTLPSSRATSRCCSRPAPGLTMRWSFSPGDRDIGRLHAVVAKVRTDVMAGESFADVIACYPALFPAIYVALVRVGESSGKLDPHSGTARKRAARAEALRRKVTDALHYPAFVLLAAFCVLISFLIFVPPQFSAALRDFGAKTDLAHQHVLQHFRFRARPWHSTRRRRDSAGDRRSGCCCASQALRAAILDGSSASARPLRRHVRLLSGGIRSAAPSASSSAATSRSTTTLAYSGRHHACRPDAARCGKPRRSRSPWRQAVGCAHRTCASCRPWRIRMLRLGEVTWHSATLAGRVADFYEASCNAAWAAWSGGGPSRHRSHQRRRRRAHRVGDDRAASVSQ